MEYRALTAEEMARKLKPLFGKKVDELYFRYSVANSLEEKNEIFQLMSSLYQKHLRKLLDKSVLLEPPQKYQVQGDYPLGDVSYAGKSLYEFSLREQDWPRHVCVSGMSGSGKTTFAINILKDFIKKEKPFLVFDWKKSFRPLMGADKDIMTFTIGNDAVSNMFKVNINRPPQGVNPKEWLNTLCDLLTESFSVSFGVHKVLMEVLDEAFEGWGVYSGSNLYPNWQHIKKLLEMKMREAKGRETGWYESAMRVASVLTFGSFGKTVNYDGKKAFSVEDLFDKKVILELNSLSQIEKKFFCEYILTYIYKLKKTSPNGVDSGFNHAILVDEAHNIFLKSQTNFMAESVTDMIYREMREYGTGLICLDQHISKLSDTVTGNSACHVAFQQQLPQDIEGISSLMQLKERKELFSQLEVGQGIVKLAERYNQPFLLKVPYSDMRKETLSDEDVATRMQCLVNGFEVEKYEDEFLGQLRSETNAYITHPSFSGLDIYAKPSALTSAEKQRPAAKKDIVETTVHQKESDHVIKEKTSEPTAEPANLIKTLSPEVVGKLTSTQELLHKFICQKMEEGLSLLEVESVLSDGLGEGTYTEKDIFASINHTFKVKFGKANKANASDTQTDIESVEETIHIVEKPEVTAEEVLLDSEGIFPETTNGKLQTATESEFNDQITRGLPPAEKGLIVYLTENPVHKNSTVELYKAVGLSARKGNVVKNNLIAKGLIKVEEERTEKGWKKYIRLNK